MWLFFQSCQHGSFTLRSGMAVLGTWLAILDLYWKCLTWLGRHRDHEGGSPLARFSHCTPAELTRLNCGVSMTRIGRGYQVWKAGLNIPNIVAMAMCTPTCVPHPSEQIGPRSHKLRPLVCPPFWILWKTPWRLLLLRNWPDRHDFRYTLSWDRPPKVGQGDFWKKFKMADLRPGD